MVIPAAGLSLVATVAFAAGGHALWLTAALVLLTAAAVHRAAGRHAGSAADPLATANTSSSST
ncbi:MAG: hypothetical protein M0Z30_15900 [Actinomycetota bacterium]|nr:hypothetical protein [Actinomycetota bacterium]